MIENSVQEFPHNTALIFEGYRISYIELFVMVKKFASFLSTIGIKKRDVVAILLSNMIQTVIAYYGQ